MPLILALAWLCGTATASSLSYRVAALQAPRLGNPALSPAANTAAQLSKFATMMRQANASVDGSPDVVIVPEWEMWTLSDGTLEEMRLGVSRYAESIPAVGTVITGCDGCYGPQISAFAQFAVLFDVLFVGNMLHRINCTAGVDTCPSDGFFLFNTEVLLAPNGTLVAVYHKNHLFDEWPLLNVPPSPFNAPASASVFLPRAIPVTASGAPLLEAPLGGVVTFGTLVCFDLEFSIPASTLVQAGVRDFLVSSMWLNTFPVNDALMAQQAFSGAHGVNLAIANAAVGLDGAGSGIYSNGNVIAYTFDRSDPDVMAGIAVGTLITPPPQNNRVKSQFDHADIIAMTSSSHERRAEISSSGSAVSRAQATGCIFPRSSETEVMPCMAFSVPITAQPAWTGLGASVPAKSPFLPLGRTINCVMNGSFAVVASPTVSVGAEDWYLVLAATAASMAFPESPGPLNMEACSIVACQGSIIDNVLSCQNIDATGPTVMLRGFWLSAGPLSAKSGLLFQSYAGESWMPIMSPGDSFASDVYKAPVGDTTTVLLYSTTGEVGVSTVLVSTTDNVLP